MTRPSSGSTRSRPRTGTHVCSARLCLAFCAVISHFVLKRTHIWLTEHSAAMLGCAATAAASASGCGHALTLWGAAEAPPEIARCPGLCSSGSDSEEDWNAGRLSVRPRGHPL